ncbi:hypothetical protein ACSBR1_002557 [Camellia fascicularis]
MKGCSWFVHARVLDANGFFYIRKWDSEHSCGIAIRTVKNSRLGSDIVSGIFSQRICDKPLTILTDVAFDLKKNYMLEISYRVAWLGIEKARGELFGAHSAFFDQLRWNNEAVMEHNPSTYINIECDEHDNRFEREGSKKIYLLPLQRTETENLQNAFGDDKTFTFISDRHVGLIESMPIIFPTAHHAFCLQHLQRNLKDKLKYMNNLHKIGLITKFNNCMYAPTVSAFEDMVGKFTRSDKAIATDFLRDLPLQNWANAYFRGNQYGEMCSNATESFNNWIAEAHHLPITRLVDSIRT